MNVPTLTKPIRRLAQVVLSASLLLGTNPLPASAAELITVSSDELLIAEPGTRTNVAEVPIDPDQVGQLCRLSVISQNQASIHHGNDLVVTTAGIETTIPDVEAEADASTDISVDLLLGTTVTVDLVMGEDWVSSLGFSLSLECGTDKPPLLADDPVCPEDATSGEVIEGEAGDVSCSTTVEPAPAPIEVPVPPLVAEIPSCSDESAGPAGAMTLEPLDCSELDSQETSAPAPNPTAPEPEVVPPPQAEQPAATTAVAPSAPKSDPEVLGQQVDRLPQSQPAVAIARQPTYNG